jgi:hypothetical protein
MIEIPGMSRVGKGGHIHSSQSISRSVVMFTILNLTKAYFFLKI